MSIHVVCTGCETVMKVPDAAAGKLVKCPNCETRTKVPTPKVESELEEEPRPRPKAKAVRPIDEDNDEEEERPRKKKAAAKTKSGGNKVLILVLVAVGGLIIVGGVGAVVYFMKGNSTKPNGNSVAIAKDLQTITPQKTFTVVLPKSDSGSPVDTRKLLFDPSGSRLIIQLGQSNEVQIWDVQSDPKLMLKSKGTVNGISTDGKILRGYFGVGDSQIDSTTGGPTPKKYIGASTNDIHGSVHFENNHFNWLRSTDWNKSAPLLVREGQAGSSDTIASYPAGDDNRVVLAEPINQFKELVFGVPAQNKIRVFGIESKSIVREYELEKPRPFKGFGSVPSWDGFVVHPEGKWIAVRRRFGSEDPLQFFDSKGTLHSQVGEKKFHETSGMFAPGRDLYVAGLYPAAGATTAEGFDLIRKEVVVSFTGHKSSIACIAFSGNGKLMASATLQGEVCIFDLTQLK